MTLEQIEKIASTFRHDPGAFVAKLSERERELALRLRELRRLRTMPESELYRLRQRQGEIRQLWYVLHRLAECGFPAIAYPGWLRPLEEIEVPPPMCSLSEEWDELESKLVLERQMTKFIATINDR